MKLLEGQSFKKKSIFQKCLLFRLIYFVPGGRGEGDAKLGVFCVPHAHTSIVSYPRGRKPSNKVKLCLVWGFVCARVVCFCMYRMACCARFVYERVCVEVVGSCAVWCVATPVVSCTGVSSAAGAAPAVAVVVFWMIPCRTCGRDNDA